LERLEFPRRAEDLRAALDDGPPPARAAELVSRLGILGDASDVDRVLTLSEHPNLHLQAAAVRALARLGTPRATDRLRTLAHSVHLAALGIDALGLSTDPGALATLEELAEHPNRIYRHRALAALAMQGGPNARRILHDAFARAGRMDAWQAAGALATLGGEPEARLLVYAATQPRDPRAEAALHALASLPGPRSRTVLIETARSATGARRNTALGLLGNIPDPEAVEILLESWDTVPGSRGTIIEAFAVSRAPGVLDALLSIVDEVPPPLMVSFTHALASRSEQTAREVLRSLAAESGPLATASLQALSMAGDPQLVDLLVARLDEDGELPPPETLSYLATQGGGPGWELMEEVLAVGGPNQRRAVVWALQSRGDEDAVIRLLDLVQTDSSWGSIEAMSALENMGGGAQDSLRELLIARLEGGAGPDVNATISSLGRLGGEGVHEALSSQLELGTSAERRAAISALGSLDGPAASETLKGLLDNEDPATRGAALQALSWREGQVLSMEVLDKVLSDEDYSVRSAALSTLSAQGTPEAIERLVSMSTHEDASTRTAALGALGQTGGPVAEEVLLAALDDPEVASKALWTLDMMASPKGGRAIRDLAKDGDSSIQIQAIGLLGNDTSQEAGEILRSQLRVEDPAEASAAVMALQARGSSDAAETIAEFFDSMDEDDPELWDLRFQVAGALQRLGGPLAAERKEALEASAISPLGEEGGMLGTEYTGGLGFRGIGVGGSGHAW